MTSFDADIYEITIQKVELGVGRDGSSLTGTVYTLAKPPAASTFDIASTDSGTNVGSMGVNVTNSSHLNKTFKYIRVTMNSIFKVGGKVTVGDDTYYTSNKEFNSDEQGYGLLSCQKNGTEPTELNGFYNAGFANQTAGATGASISGGAGSNTETSVYQPSSGTFYWIAQLDTDFTPTSIETLPTVSISFNTSNALVVNTGDSPTMRVSFPTITVNIS